MVRRSAALLLLAAALAAGPARAAAAPAAAGRPTHEVASDVACDATHSCPQGSTCCCVTPLRDFCISWGCCPLQDATCCPDHVHCCPANLPVCNEVSRQCSSQSNQHPLASAPWYDVEPARTVRAM